MDDAALVGGCKPGADLSRDLERAILGEPSEAPKQGGEILAVHVLHREKRVSVDFVDVVHAADVGVRDLPRHPHFRVQLRQACRVAIDGWRQEFQGDGLAELQVVRSIDLTHTTPAETPDDPVAAAEQRTGIESPVIDGAR